MIYTALSLELSDAALPPWLAVIALALTFSIYFVSLYELPPLAQTFLLIAQGLVLFPVDTGEALPRWSSLWVAAVTLAMVAWWSRQRVTRRGPWIVLLNLVYSLALVGLAYHLVRPHVDLQNWMVDASVLSFAFLVFGALTRVWPIALMGQVFLAIALYHFFLPAGDWEVSPWPWAWWAVAVPLAVVFSTGRAIHGWLKVFPEMDKSWQDTLRVLAYGYQSLALAMIIRWISAAVPLPGQISAFLFLGTLLVVWNVRGRCAFGIRCGFVLSVLGLLIYLEHFQADEVRAMALYINALAILAFLAQPLLLRRHGPVLISQAERWAVILLSAGMGWIFVSAWVVSRIQPNYLTVGWALYALFLFFLGLLVHERRQRWCGLGILVAALLRVACYDMWGFSSGYRVLTLFVLTLITLGLGFIYARFAERLKTWL